MSDSNQKQSLGLDEILNAAMGVMGAGQQPAQQQGNNPLGDVLGSLLGGAAGQQAPQQPANPLGDVLGSLLGGAAGQQHAPQQPANPLGDVLGSLLGGAAGQQQAPQQPANPLGDVLGSILGGMTSGGQTQSGGGMGVLGDILAGVMGGGNASTAMSQTGISGSIINGIAQKTGLPPMVIYMALTFVIGKLMADARKPARQQSLPQPQAPGLPQGGLMSQAQPPAAQAPSLGSELDDILHRMQGGKHIDKNYIHQNGLADELGGQLGLPSDKAGDLLHEVFGVLQHLPNR